MNILFFVPVDYELTEKEKFTIEDPNLLFVEKQEFTSSVIPCYEAFTQGGERKKEVMVVIEKLKV